MKRNKIFNLISQSQIRSFTYIAILTEYYFYDANFVPVQSLVILPMKDAALSTVLCLEIVSWRFFQIWQTWKFCFESFNWPLFASLTVDWTPLKSGRGSPVDPRLIVWVILWRPLSLILLNWLNPVYKVHWLIVASLTQGSEQYASHFYKIENIDLNFEFWNCDLL